MGALGSGPKTGFLVEKWWMNGTLWHQITSDADYPTHQPVVKALKTQKQV